MFEDGLPDLRPASFFSLAFDCRYILPESWEKTIEQRKYKIPNTAFLCLEETFAEINMGWHEDGLFFAIHSSSPATKSSFPDVIKGDSVELFIDTRDVKTTGFTTKFCHHFFFLPNEVDGQDRGEITRFRNEDAHELCQAQFLDLITKKTSHGYLLKIFIPAHCLFGYDPKETMKLGFDARINQHEGPSQHFSVVTEEFPVEQQPSLWSSVKLIK